jgi:hypothetical protein
MNHIETISIKNARRLGEDVKLDFGKGATIILAPNGTGKTTIFEAIELALTGGIKRIDGTLNAIIKDGCSDMSVKLDFLDGRYCQADISKNGDLVRKGNFNELFHTESEASLPYLFRLTHYLEQRSNEWLIEKNGQDAGDMLNKLPLGRDLQNILLKKSNVLRGISTEESRLATALSNARNKLSGFSDLKVKRDSITVAINLIPLKEILDNLKNIAASINYSNYTGEQNLVQISEYFERLKVFSNQKYNVLKDLLVKLSIMKDKIGFYTNNEDEISKKQMILKDYEGKIEAAKTSVEQMRIEIKLAGNVLADIESTMRGLTNDKLMFKKAAQAELSCKMKCAELSQCESELTEAAKIYDKAAEYLAQMERNRDQHKIISDEISKLLHDRTQMEYKINYLQMWTDIVTKNNEMAIKNPGFDIRRANCTEVVAHFKEEYDKAEEQYGAKKKSLDLLKSVTGAIQDAVSTIKMNLPGNQGKCPVCQAEYEPSVLANKIAASLEAINPSILLAIEEERQALSNFEIAREKYEKAQQELLEIDTEIKKIAIIVGENQSKLQESIKPQFPGCGTPDEAKKNIDEQISHIISDIKKLEADKNQLDSEISIEGLTKARLDKNERERAVKELSDRKQRLLNDIAVHKEESNRIEEYLNGKEESRIEKTLSDKTIEFEKKKELVHDLEGKQASYENELLENQKLSTNEKDKISQLQGIQNSILTEWRQAGFDGQPEQERYKTGFDGATNSSEEIEKINVKLDLIEQNISGWRVAEKFNEADREIKRQVGNSSEEEYQQSLEAEISKLTGTLGDVSQKREAVDHFFEELAAKNKELNKELDSINEPWEKLRRRIIVTPLISSGPLLNNSTFRNKQIAKTSTIIHDADIEINRVASEAQIADLQLTFMLAIANRYRWTDWKGLLLDDPTHYHDLVHTSSIFDLLRDHMIEFSYQVLMSTHDSTHAYFLHRKLRNDGVPSKIYQLVTRKNGVVAERIY